MNQKVIKELQKLLALCVEIGDSTSHYISFHLSKSNKMDLFDINVYKDCELTETADCIADCEHLTLENMSRCRQELLKYKEW